MNANVIVAIFKRNFSSYFSNPTGYVFICVFVFLSSLAAFWPDEFFNSNLANLNQLNKYLPYILLVFIPAITMSIWAEERRQGTDELLLTIPAGDFDVVFGKYLAAVAIYAVSLLFSLVCNFTILRFLGYPDPGLILGTYFGYFVVGLAMLAIGMTASFLTGNLTVGFIAGALFNAPLVFAGLAPEWAKLLRQFSIEEQFRDFARGVVSLSGLTFFLSLVAVMLYVSMVLIGRRHWRGGADAPPMPTHYAVRFVALLLAAIGLNAFFAKRDPVRMDVTSERLSSISPQTKALLRKLDVKYPVHIDAFVSHTVPENYVQTRLNLISTLRELEAAARDKIKLDLHDMEPFSAEATRAETEFGVRPRRVLARSGGVQSAEEIFMGLSVRSGLEKVTVPFLERGIPVEYEVVRSIATVCQEKRKKIGVLTTDAKLFGGFDMQTMGSTPNQMIVDELQKQYEVVQVDPANPITEKYDVLLAVQPSSLGPPQLDNFINAVRSGQATAIFEDPMPVFINGVVGTEMPKQPPGGMNPFMGRQPPQPKGDIKPLWALLGVDFDGTNIVWQDYNPIPKAPDLPHELVFIDRASGATQPFDAFNDDSPISAKIQRVCFPFPGSVRAMNSSSLKFVPLTATNNSTGIIRYDQILEQNFMGQPQLNPEMHLLERRTNDQYTMAAQITGKPKADAMMSDQEPKVDVPAPAKEPAKEPAAKDAAPETAAPAAKEVAPPAVKAEPTPSEVTPPAFTLSKPVVEEKPKDVELNVVLVADIDCLMGQFFAILAAGIDEEGQIDWDLDNVTFVLNTLDKLAGDDRFIAIRTRKPRHRTLENLEAKNKDAIKLATEQRKKFADKFTKEVADEQKKFEESIVEMQKRENLNQREAINAIAIAQQQGRARITTKTEQLKQERDREVKTIDRNLQQSLRATQDRYKLWSVLLPPIPPLVLGFFVYFNRRQHEREGVSKSRLRTK